MKTIAKWFFLLNKRLYKKATFVIILALVPTVVLGLGIVAKQDSGFATIALAQDDNLDPVSNEIIEELMYDNSLLRFKRFETRQEATESVILGQCDSAWIFLDNMSERMNAFSEESNSKNAVVNVVEREQNVLLRISHEKLSNVLYKYFSKDLYIGYIRTNVSELENLSEAELMQYYDSFFVDGELFEFAYSGINPEEISYLVAPVRGLLSVLVALCAMASAMFFIQDEKRGTFSWLPESRKIYMEFICQIIAVMNISIAMLSALAISGLTVSLTREIIILVLYIVATALFGMLLRNLFNSIKALGALIPLFITVMIALCPVFFEFKKFKFLQMLFPPTYYINAINNTNFVNHMIIYIIACMVLIAVINVLRLLKNRVFIKAKN